MSRVIDRRKIAMGGYTKRSVKQINKIAVHFSASSSGSSANFENFWKNTRGWVTGGYHEVVLLNGDVEVNYDPTVITNGIKGHNTSTYHICYVGKREPNEAQFNTIRKRVKRAKNLFKINNDNILGHREFEGAKTHCPRVNVREAIVHKLGNELGAKIVAAIKPKPTPKTKGYTARIQRKLNSYRFNNIRVDDVYGPETHRALVKMYQYELNKQFNKNLVVDGIPGPKTDAAAINIRKGARGNLTYAMQAFLFFKNYLLSVDGIFGDITEEMVKQFQRNHGLKVDGIAGTQTFKKLIRR